MCVERSRTKGGCKNRKGWDKGRGFGELTWAFLNLGEYVGRDREERVGPCWHLPSLLFRVSIPLVAMLVIFCLSFVLQRLAVTSYCHQWWPRADPQWQELSPKAWTITWVCQSPCLHSQVMPTELCLLGSETPESWRFASKAPEWVWLCCTGLPTRLPQRLPAWLTWQQPLPCRCSQGPSVTAALCFLGENFTADDGLCCMWRVHPSTSLFPPGW